MWALIIPVDKMGKHDALAIRQCFQKALSKQNGRRDFALER
jgi:hypothetical protein